MFWNVPVKVHIYSQNIYEKFKVQANKAFKLVIELDKTEDGLNSLFSRHSNVIGLMTDGIKPYTPLMFIFPIVPEADLPQSEKCRFINKILEEEATKMLIELEKAGVIRRSYSPWSCNSVFVPKPPPEIT